MKSEDWIFGNDPPSMRGWYAVIICFDEREGLFPQALYSDGHTWAKKLPVTAIGNVGPFASEQEAHDFAYAHDPEEVRSTVRR